MKTPTGITQFETMIETLTDTQLGALIREYITENTHQGWDGFDNPTVKAIGKLLGDITLYHNNS